jgi:hypothetical protein
VRKPSLALLAIGLFAAASLLAQTSYFYGSNVTGQLALCTGAGTCSPTVNALQQAQTSAQGAQFSALRTLDLSANLSSDFIREAPILSPEIPQSFRPVQPRFRLARRFSQASLARPEALPSLSAHALPVNTASSAFGFMGVTHYDERNANGGNQFSIEPPSQGLAVANGFVVEGVNNAFQVYNAAGAPLLPAVISTNQLFGMAPAINRSTIPSVCGPYPTDIRVFYDQTLNRFFVMQRAQDYDLFCDALPSSHLYIAVSQTGDPTGTYNVYTMDTTDSQTFGCPCISDYPEIGADQYGIYLTWDEYDTNFSFRGAVVLAVSKASLGANASTPTAYQFRLPYRTGYEVAIQPATTPPGGSYFLASGGLEYFVSSQTTVLPSVSLALWAMTNTSTLATANPSLTLIEVSVPAPLYQFPPNANQRLGTLSLGSTLELLDGSDTRIQSVEYMSSRLYVTLGTSVNDDNGKSVAAGLYSILSPSYRGGVLNASVLNQGYIYVNNNHILRPAAAVNAQGQGAIVFTLVGPDYYPSAAFLPITTTFNGTPGSLIPVVGSTIQIAGAGFGPEDGFSGYSAYGGFGVARWGDYSGAVVSADGSIWMGTEYIPNAPRTTLANWGTYLIHLVP